MAPETIPSPIRSTDALISTRWARWLTSCSPGSTSSRRLRLSRSAASTCWRPPFRHPRGWGRRYPRTSKASRSHASQRIATPGRRRRRSSELRRSPAGMSIATTCRRRGPGGKPTRPPRAGRDQRQTARRGRVASSHDGDRSRRSGHGGSGRGQVTVWPGGALDQHHSFARLVLRRSCLRGSGWLPFLSILRT
jgi:hypothetical protein